ncbi:Phage tail protein [Granulibacter bethesdensis]|uniref:Phage tail protein n=1 Tax=Granulibacter bethesdensis TaxID=364410 RepID=A0AAN0VFY8_9PROT|nr:hypothetical protein [Granulibacter bethesdensis]AHJ63262.1 Phage tail protein [Granulibacter bethesdensis]
MATRNISTRLSVEGASEAKAALESIGVAAEATGARMAAGLGRAGQAGQDVTPALASAGAGAEKLAAAFEKAAASADPYSIRMAKARDMLQAVTAAQAAGVAPSERAATVTALLTNRLDQLHQAQMRALGVVEQVATTNQRAMASFGGMGNVIHQAGYQVGDFAVQIASGQSAITAFVQQGAQMLGVFGTWGAVAGAGLAIAGAVLHLVEASSDAKKAGDELSTVLETHQREYSAAKEAAEDYTHGLVHQAEAMESLANRFASLDDAQKKFETARLAAEFRALNDQLERQNKALSDAAQKTLDSSSLYRASQQPGYRTGAAPQTDALAAAGQAVEDFRLGDGSLGSLQSLYTTLTDLAQIGGKAGGVIGDLRDQVGSAVDPARKLDDSLAEVGRRGDALTGSFDDATLAVRAFREMMAETGDSIATRMERVQAQARALQTGGLDALKLAQKSAVADEQADRLSKEDMQASVKALQDQGYSEAMAMEAIVKNRDYFTSQAKSYVDQQNKLNADIAAAEKKRASDARASRQSATADRAADRADLRSDNTVSALEGQISSLHQLTVAYHEGDAAIAGITAQQKANTDALKYGREGTAAYAAEYQKVLPLYQQVAEAEQTLALAKKNAADQSSLDYIEAETRTLGMNDAERSKMLSHMKLEAEFRAQGIPLLSDEAQKRIALTDRIIEANGVLARQQAAFNELQSFGENTFNTIGTAITQAFATGKLEAVSFKDIAMAALSSIAQEALKLAVLNPLQNWLLGTDKTDLGGVLGTLLGSASGGGSVSSGGGYATYVAGATGLAGMLLSLGGDDMAATATHHAATAAGSAGSTLGTISAVGKAAGGGDFFDAVGTGATAVGILDKGYSLLNGSKEAVTTSTGLLSYLGSAVKPLTSIVSGVAGTLTNLNTLVAGTVANGINALLYPGAYAAGQIGATAAGIAPTVVTGGISSAGYLGGAASTAANTANAAGAAGGVSASTIAAAIPWISVIVGIAIPLIKGDLESAGIVAASAGLGAIAGSFVPVIGTAIGAALGAAIGGIITMFTADHPLSPYTQVDILNKNGRLAIGHTGQQIAEEQLDADKTGAQTGIEQVNKMLDFLQLKIANTGDTQNNIAGERVGIVGTGLDESIKAVRSIGDLFPYLRFAANNADSNYARAATAQLKDQSYANPQALAEELQKIASFADGLNALGIHLDTMDRDFKNLRIGMADRVDGSNFSVALAHDLPGRSFADRDALQQEIQKVFQFTEGTLPSLLSWNGRAQSQFQQQMEQLNKVYADASSQALAYGLTLNGLGDKFAQLQRQMYDEQLLAFRQSDAGVTARYLSATGNDRDAALISYDVKAAQENAALKKAWQDVFGDAATSMAEYQQQAANLDRTHYAERLKMQQTYDEQTKASAEQSKAAAEQALSSWRQVNATGLSFVTADWRAQVAIATANDNSVGTTKWARQLSQAADLADFDQNASSQMISYKASLQALYGAGYATNADYAAQITRAEKSLAEQRLAIVANYAKQAKQAEEQAAGQVSNVVVSLSDYLKTLKTGENSPLAPRAQYDAALTQFNSTAQAAQAGDYTSLTHLRDAAESYRSMAAIVYGSGQGYADAVSRIADVLGHISEVPTDTLTSSAMDAIAKTNAQTIVTAVSDLKAEVIALRRQMQTGQMKIA